MHEAAALLIERGYLATEGRFGNEQVIFFLNICIIVIIFQIYFMGPVFKISRINTNFADQFSRLSNSITLNLLQDSESFSQHSCLFGMKFNRDGTCLGLPSGSSILS